MKSHHLKNRLKNLKVNLNGSIKVEAAVPKAKAEGVELGQGIHVLKGHSFIAKFYVTVNPYDDQTPVQACHHVFVSGIL